MLSKETKQRIAKFKAMGIHITVQAERDFYTVIVSQKELINHYLLSQSQLVSRAAEVLDEIKGSKIKWIPITYEPDLDTINHEWVNEQMKKFKIKRKDICKHLGIDRHHLSKLMNNESWTRFQRAAFYFYFQTFEINALFRD